MRIKRLAAIVALMTVAGLGAAAPGAQAGVRGEPLYGDFNNDGLVDSAVLGVVEPNLCSTIVVYGSGPGVFLPPVAYTYPKPGGGTVYTDCPDIGVAVDMDDDPEDEVWVGWTPGPPPPANFTLVVLQPPNFAPSASFNSHIAQPVFMGSGRFSGGGRFSPYTVGPGGVQNFIVDGTSVIPGPIDYCSVDTPTVELADWNRDGTDGALVSYTNGCTDHSNGVLRIRKDGSIQQLQIDPTGQTSWDAKVVNVNSDRYLDVRTMNKITGEVNYFINDALNMVGVLVRSPDANTDAVVLTKPKAITIDVLANDYASRYAEIIITSPPRYGTVQVLSDRRIVYRPNPTHGRTDRFTYQLVEGSRRSSATVSVKYPV
ncbi:Ig-like domain-containing protein [Plantactinospora solaniradicis]|uniref:Ig-like domain-containing protein n=1 Tax=Plantactinospora solaniradicis TaxID=1723736 RepID=A0ABW1KA16_9ACTN